MVENKKKPKWGKPKLIILIRGKPEEGVLAGCKSGAHGAGYPGAFQVRCRQPFWCYESCAASSPS